MAQIYQPFPGFGFDAEILALAKTMGYRIKEIPVVWIDHAVGSTVKATTYLHVLWETVQIRLWLWFGRYPIAKIT